MLGKISITALLLALVVTMCAAESQLASSHIEDLLTDLNEEDDLRNHLDLEDFKQTVGVSYDEWLKHARSLETSVIEELQQATEERSEDELEDTLISSNEDFGIVKKAVKHVKKAVAPVVKVVKKHVVEPVKQVVTKGLDYFKQKAIEWGKGMLAKVLGKIQWKPAQYWKHMTRITKDFTGAQINTNDDYTAFHKHADKATQAMLNFAYKSMPHQDKCDRKAGGWNEYHPTPFSEIVKANPGKSPFHVEPFKYQYENDPNGYFQEPCNAISNGFFLSTFNEPVLHSKNNCGSATSAKDPFAMDCINEDHLLQVATAAMPFGSWFMHGSGGFSLGGFLDVRGMDVQFYLMYRQVLKEYVFDANIRKALEFPHACNAKTVPDKSDGISWIDPKTGERLCHLYWARQMKKLLTNATLIENHKDTTYAKAMLKGLPDMSESIAGCVFVTLRAVFHKKFPFGEEIYTKLTEILVNALMGGASAEVKQGAMAMGKALHKDKVLGFENPHDGLVHILNIFGDFMDAMFFQESGKFGPGTFYLKKLTPVDAGCTLAPHATWHRKASRVITGFIKMGKSLQNKLKNPDSMVTFKMGLPPTGLYVKLIAGVSGLVESLTATFNMKTLAGANLDPSEGGKDLLDTPGFIKHITARFGKGWPTTGDFPGDKWPKCQCKRASIKEECSTGAPTDAPTRAPTDRRTRSPTGTPTGTPIETPTGTPTDAPIAPTTDAPVAPTTDAPVANPTSDVGKEAAAQSKAARAAAAAAQGAADEAKDAATEATKIAAQLKALGVQ
jgi:hypothetical protein